MRLRSFTGRTTSDAMGQVRRQLGADAVIISTDEDDDGLIRITAALDSELPLPPPEPREGASDTIGTALAGHGVPRPIADKIVAASFPFDGEEPLVALSSALATLYRFKPIAGDERGRFLFTGPPGAGKTVTVAKLAARAVRAGAAVRLVTADAARAGAADQLAAFARILGVALHQADDAGALKALLAEAPSSDLLLIDSAGVNPYAPDDRRELRALVAASGAEPVLVLPGGGDAAESLDLARGFADSGCSRLIATRLDMTRRLGSILGVADALGMSFGEAGNAPSIADGLAAFNPVVLARLLLSAAAVNGHSKRRGDA